MGNKLVFEFQPSFCVTASPTLAPDVNVLTFLEKITPAKIKSKRVVSFEILDSSNLRINS